MLSIPKQYLIIFLFANPEYIIESTGSEFFKIPIRDIIFLGATNKQKIDWSYFEQR